MNKRFVSILLALMLTFAMALPVMAGGTNSGITLAATPGTDSVSLSWSPVTDTNGFSGYYVYRSTQSGSVAGTPAYDFPLNATTFTDRNIEKGITYYYTVRPVYGTTVGSPSNEVQVKVGSAGVTIIMEIGNYMMQVNGVSQPIDPSSNTVTPIIASNRTFVPIRSVVEALGGRLAYDANARMVTVTLDNTTINMWIDNKNIKVNGVNKVMDVAPFISSSRTFLPLRFVLENLNCTTEWNGQLARITIKRLAISGGTGQVTGPTGPGGVITTPPGSIIPGSSTSGTGTTGTTQQGLNWDGNWDTTFQLLELDQQQGSNQVTGTYDGGTLTGTTSKNAAGLNVLTATFEEINGFEGVLTFTMSANGNSFTGTWHYTNSEANDTREWNGQRMAN